MLTACVQEYLDLQEKLGASLRDGRFFIARSRYHTGPLGVSDARIPKHMSASTGARLHGEGAGPQCSGGVGSQGFDERLRIRAARIGRS